MILESVTATPLLGSFVATIGSTGSHEFMISLRVFNDFTRVPCC